MQEITDAELDEARRRGDIAWATEPRAVSVSYEPEARRFVIELKSGCTFVFPADLAQGLKDVSNDLLADVELQGDGYGLHWETLNEDYSVTGLLAGRFGTARYMAEMAGNILAKERRARSGRDR